MMSHDHRYESLSTSEDANIPQHPPNYNDLDADLYAGAAEEGNRMMEFEIEDELEEPTERESLMARTSFATRKLMTRMQNRFVRPVSNFIDPICEGCSFLSSQYEKSILKLGNPLVVKRLLYVFLILGVVFFVSRSSINNSVNGASGGAFSSGKFYDIDILSSSIKDLVEPNMMKENLEYFSSMPHIAGSKGDLALAKYIQSYMVNDGINIVNLNELETFINYPSTDKNDRYLKLADESYEASLFEYNKDSPEYVAFNADSFSLDDELEASYIYGGQGDPEDFKKLSDSNIPVNNSILLLKYGGKTLESNKVFQAAKVGAKAVVFITPKFKVGSGDLTFEKDTVIQNSDVAFSRKSTGDIMISKWIAGKGHQASNPSEELPLAPKIPTIPISWKDGQVFLKKLGKRGVKMDEFYSGDSKSAALKMKSKNHQRPLHRVWNVVGSIRGREQSEKGVIIGASRDSKCFGTLSTNSGSVILLEMVKIFTMLQRKYNWSPSRSIYFVSFDASEYNVAGAHEWVESRKESLKKEGYAYIDLSDAVTGDKLMINSHPFFHDLITDALKSVYSQDVEHVGKTDKVNTLYEIYKKQNGNKDSIKNKFYELKNYIPFINLINTPSLEIKFRGSNVPQGSCFDNFENFEKSKIDKDMNKHGSLVQLISLIVLQLAEKPIVPYNFIDLSESLLAYQKDLERFATDHIKGSDKPLNFGEMINSINALKKTAEDLNGWFSSWTSYIEDASGNEPSIITMTRWKYNEDMIDFNGLFIDEGAGKERPGYLNHLIGVPLEAPVTANDDYEWNSFPIVRGYIMQNKIPEAQKALDQLAKKLQIAAGSFNEY